MGSVGQFWSELVTKKTSNLKLWLGGVVAVAAVALALAAPWKDSQVQQQAPQLSEDDFRSELESKIRLELIQQNLNDLFTTLTFDTRWEAALWDEVRALETLLGVDDPLRVTTYEKAYGEYLKKIKEAVASENFEKAKRWLASAQKYTSDTTELNAINKSIAAAIAEIDRKKQEEQQRQAAAKAIADAKAAEVKQVKNTAASSKHFDAALTEINEQLACNRLLDMPALEKSLALARKADPARYSSAEPTIVASLADCITRITRNFPDEGIKAQRYAQTLFAGHAAFTVKASASNNDSCKESLAGLGSRGLRSRCQDSLPGGLKTPATVVIPSQGQIPAFAIGRYEVSVAEFNQYCLASRECQAIAEQNTGLPITNISFKQVMAYLSWLSKKSGHTYRLPTQTEWAHAAKARSSNLDSNRNCTLNVRGIQKGGTLIQANIGQQNAWGVVNFVGNAKEWVYQSEQLLAIGGSYNTPMQDCTIDNIEQSNGQGDEETGFRVLRQLQ